MGARRAHIDRGAHRTAQTDSLPSRTTVVRAAADLSLAKDLAPCLLYTGAAPIERCSPETRNAVESAEVKTSQEDPMIGRTLSQYRIVRKIAQGGMGAVYEAKHLESGIRAAVKVLLPELGSRADAVSRFFTEARATSMLEHEALVKIFEHGKSPDGEAFIIMEFIDGESLREAQEKKYFGGSALILLHQMASGLAVAHGKRIIHRDLKPDNIMLVPDPTALAGVRAKILDFGIAKMLPDGSAKDSASAATRTGTLIGTPMYMSPEQCRASAPPDEKTDVYSLGIILYEMLYGEPPFTSESAGELFALQMFADPPRLKERVPALADKVDELVHRLLGKQPATRPTMTEVAIELAGIPSTGLNDGAAQDRPSKARRRAQAESGEPVGSTSDIVRAQLTGTTRNSERGEMVGRAQSSRSSLLPVILSASVLLIVVVALLTLRSKQQRAQPQGVTTAASQPAQVPKPPDAGSPAGRVTVAGPEPVTPTTTTGVTESAAAGKHGKSGKSGKGVHRAGKGSGTNNKVQIELWQ